VRSDYDWAAVAPGQTVAIPLVGWSTGTVSDWFLRASTVSTSPDLAAEQPALCNPAIMNAGAVAEVSLTMDPSAVPGDFVTVRIDSFTDDPNDPSLPFGDDYYHAWFVGFYVPIN
jgi:hypothetical protein